jgi:uncharacterized protein (TIGR02145 family)
VEPYLLKSLKINIMSKNKAWIQYTKYGEIVPGSLIVSPRRPVNGVWYEVVTDICCDTEPPFGLISSKQKAFVKYDASGNIVPGSLVLTDGRLPKPGIWKEVYIDICCSTTTSTTTTTTIDPLFPITICGATWSGKNLDVTNFRNGDPIPLITDLTAWAAAGVAGQPAYTYVNGDSNNTATYGLLYNWYAANDPRGIGPSGWHVPNDTEWDALRTCLGGSALAGGAMKETGTTHWAPPNTGATNSSGFTSLPAGTLESAVFGSLTTGAYYWSATTNPAFSFQASRYYNDYAGTQTSKDASYYKGNGVSVRLVKD